MGAYSADIIAWCQQVPPTEKRVRYKSDFPAAVGGIITLDPNTSYHLVGVVDLGTDVIEGSNIIIYGDPMPSVGLTTTSASPLLTADGTGGFCYVNGCQLVNNGPGGLFDFSVNPAVPPGAVLVNGNSMTSLGPVGTISSAPVAVLSNFASTSLDGLDLTGAISANVINAYMLSFPGAPAYKAISVTNSANIQALNITGSVFTLGNAADIGLSFDAGATYTNPVQVTACSFGTTGTAIDPAGLQKSDKEVIANGNTGLEDSLFTARASFAGNAQVTTFASSAFVGIGNGTPGHPLFVLNAVSERFTLTGATTDVQVLTCDSLQPHAYRLTAVVNVYKSGTVNDVSFAWYVNNVQMTTSAVTIEVSPSKKSATVATLVTLSPGDFCQLKLSNPSLANIVVQAASIEAHRI